MKQHLAHLLKFKVLQSNKSHFLAFLLLALAAWFSGLVMAEFTGGGTLEQSPNAIVWPMLPGESLNQLAALFYPGNKPMQRRFVSKTQELSHELNPTLDPNTVFSHPAMLVIPELKTLARHAASFNSHARQATATNLRMSYQIESIVTPAMRAQYEELVQRNEFLKQELQQMYQRLSSMQDNLGQLKTAVLAFLRAESSVKTMPTQKLAQKPMLELAKTEIIEQPIRKPLETQKNSAESIWFMLLIQFLAIVVALMLAIAAWAWIRKRLFKQIEAATNEQIDAIGHNTFQVSSSSFDLTKPGLLERSKNDVLLVEELDSIVDEAKILVSMDRPAGAISLLLNHIGAQPKASLHPWLYLLDLYRSQGQKEEFVAVAERLRATFNVITPQWEEKNVAMVVADGLEEFPHIISKLQEICATAQFQEYLAGLLEDNREGERAGFSLNVLREIALLKDVWEARESIPEQSATP